MISNLIIDFRNFFSDEQTHRCQTGFDTITRGESSRTPVWHPMDLAADWGSEVVVSSAAELRSKRELTTVCLRQLDLPVFLTSGHCFS